MSEHVSIDLGIVIKPRRNPCNYSIHRLSDDSLIGMADRVKIGDHEIGLTGDSELEIGDSLDLYFFGPDAKKESDQVEVILERPE